MPNPGLIRRLFTGGVNTSPPVVYDVDAQIYFNQVVTNGGAPFTTVWKNQLNSFFISLKSTGDFANLVRFHILRNANDIAAKTSLVNPSQAMLSFVGTSLQGPVYRVFYGIRTNVDPNGGVTGSYVNTNFKASTDGGVLYTQNSAYQGVGITENIDGTLIDIGCSDGVEKSYIFSALTGVCYHTLNNIQAGGDTSFANASALDANYQTRRTGATTLIGYKNNASTSGAGASAGLPSVNEYLGAYNNNGSVSLNKTANYTWYGKGSSSVSASNMNTALSALFTQKNAYFFGDSITIGSMGSSGFSYSAWTAQVCASKNWREVNYGATGTTLQYVTPFDVAGSPSMWNNQGAIPVYNATTDSALFFSYGVNDCGINFPNYTVANFTTQLTDIINTAISNGWPLGKIIIQSSTYCNPTNWVDYVTSYGVPIAADTVRFLAIQAAASSVASSLGVVYVTPYTYMSINGGNSLLFDGRHPTQTGYNVATVSILSQITGVL